MNTTVAQLTARSLLGRRRAVMLMLLPIVLLVLSAAVRVLAGQDPQIGVDLLGVFALGTIVPLLGLIVGTGAIAPEIDDGSIVYLLSKPVSRHHIVLSKFAVTVAVILVVAAVPTLIAGLLVAGGAERIAWSYAVGAAIAGIGYCALFLLLGVVSRNAVVIGLIYALIWESLIGGFVPGAQALSIQQWALAITEQLVGDSAARYGVGAAVELSTAVPLLLIVVVGGVWFAGDRLRSLRVTGEQ